MIDACDVHWKHGHVAILIQVEVFVVIIGLLFFRLGLWLSRSCRWLRGWSLDHLFVRSDGLRRSWSRLGLDTKHMLINDFLGFMNWLRRTHWCFWHK